MAEIKRSWFSANKALIFLVIASWVFIGILLISGLRKVNLTLLMAVFGAVALIIYFVMRKPKQKDLYQIIEDIGLRHYRKTQSFLDVSIDNVQCIPVTDDLMYLHFVNDGLTFELRGNNAVGVEHRWIYPVLKQREKSNLIQKALEVSGAAGKVRTAAAVLNIEPEDIGLSQ